MPSAFTVRLEDETVSALDRLAERTERSRNWLVAKAIEDYVSLNAWQIDKIEAGIAAADRKAFAKEDDVARLRSKYSARR
jgi:predicted transcriptional regulator